MKNTPITAYSPSSLVTAWSKERPDLIESGLNITLRIRGMAMLIDAHIHKTADQLGIRTDDLLLLFALRRGGAPYAMRPTDVYRLLSATSGTATYRAAKLVETGLAQRVKDPQDGRSQLIQLTEFGVQVVDRAIESLAQVSESAMKELQGSGENQLLARLLDQLETGWICNTPLDNNPLARSVIEGMD